MTTVFVNPLGIAFERTDYKKRSKVRVHNNGYHLITYRFNNVPEFESPWISWANLDQCGGWATKDEYLRTAVQNGTKLVAGIVHRADENIEVTVDVIVDSRDHGWLDGYKLTHVSRTGCLYDYYDIESVLAHYGRLGIVLTVEELHQIDEYCRIKLSEFGTEKAPFDYVNASTTVELIVTGLLLGYPLESTASILEVIFR